jgi:hypothetical protein
MTEINTPHITFHDSTVRSINQSGSKVVINLDDVSLDGKRSEESSVSAQVVICDIKGIIRNSAQTDSIDLEEDDGEMLSIHQSDVGVIMTIQWTNYNPRKIYTATYNLIGGVMSSKII